MPDKPEREKKRKRAGKSGGDGKALDPEDRRAEEAAAHAGLSEEQGTALMQRQDDASALAALRRSGADLPDLFTRDILLMHTMINGAMHVEEIHALAAGLRPGDRVKLVLEPDNPVDPWAILVRNEENRKLGYIPRAKNEVLFHLMDAGKYLYGIVTDGDIGQDADPKSRWIEIYIDVFMQD